MSTLLGQASQHRSAAIFFGCYVIVWLGLLVLASQLRQPAYLCVPLAIYPVAIGFSITAVYCLFLLFRAWQQPESRRLYLLLWLLAAATPLLPVLFFICAA